MTTDLLYLTLTAGLTAALWIPYIVGQVVTNGFLKPHNYVDPAPRPVPLWAQRLNRAHLNSVETFAPFAALVIVAHLTGEASSVTAFCSVAYFWIRLAHAVVYGLGIPYLRTVLFVLGFLAIAGIFYEVLA